MTFNVAGMASCSDPTDIPKFQNAMVTLLGTEQGFTANEIFVQIEDEETGDCTITIQFVGTSDATAFISDLDSDSVLSELLAEGLDSIVSISSEFTFEGM